MSGQLPDVLMRLGGMGQDRLEAEVKNKKSIVLPGKNSKDSLKGLAGTFLELPSPKAGEAVFGHSRHFLLGKLAVIIGREIYVPKMWEQMWCWNMLVSLGPLPHKRKLCLTPHCHEASEWMLGSEETRVWKSFPFLQALRNRSHHPDPKEASAFKTMSLCTSP